MRISEEIEEERKRWAERFIKDGEKIKQYEVDHQIATRIRLWYLDVQKAEMPMSWQDKSFKVVLQSKLEEILGISPSDLKGKKYEA